MSWTIVLKSLPAETNKPVSLKINEKTIYQSRSEDYSVSDRFTSELIGFGKFNTFIISIPSLDFSTAKKFNIEEGEFVEFRFEEEGLRISQQETPF